jgi:hypothetical protein
VDNAKLLLSASFVDQTTELIGDATPVSSPIPSPASRPS